MARVRKLTPRVLKKIINEEKAKIRRKNSSSSNDSSLERGIDAITKIALIEARELVKIKRLREKRRRLKKLLARRVK
jgi:hypothetical protein